MNELLPCAACPWRTDKDASTIPRYVHAKACNLIGTVGRGDAFRPIMACHHSIDGDEQACRGYLAQVGWSNLNVRMLLLRREISSPDDCCNACISNGIQLHETYEEVLEKLGKPESGA